MNEFERHVLEIIGEDLDSPDVFTDDDDGLEPIRDSINDAIQEISILTSGYEKTFYIPLVANQMFYRLKIQDGFFGWVTNARLSNRRYVLDQTDIVNLNRYSFTWLKDIGVPEAYFQIGRDTVGFYRKPSGTGDVVEMKCVVVPSRYQSSNEHIRLRSSFKWAVIHYAVSEYWASRGNAKEATMWFQKYMQNANFQGAYPILGDRVSEFQPTAKTNQAIPARPGG